MTPRLPFPPPIPFPPLPPSCSALVLLLVLPLALLGCGKGDGQSPSGTPDAAHVHTEDCEHAAEGPETGPHGGPVVVLGEEAAHLEVLHDEAAGEVTVHVLDGGLKPVAAEAPPVLNLVLPGGTTPLTATPVGEGGSAWRFAHEALKGEPEGARFRVQVGGKTYVPALPCAHEREQPAGG